MVSVNSTANAADRVTGERAVELIKDKRIADANKLIKKFDENPDIEVLNGRFGPYIKAGKKNVKIPKDKEPKDLTLEECIALADATPEKKGRFGRFAKKEAEPKTAKPKKKTATKKKVAKKTNTKLKVKKATVKRAAAKKKAK